MLFEIRDVRDVIQVDQSPKFCCLLVFGSQRVVGREHDVLAADPDAFAEHQFRQAGTVRAAAFFVQQPHDVRIRRGLHREVFAKTVRPTERLIQLSCVCADGGLIVNMERRRVLRSDRCQLVGGKGDWLCVHYCNLTGSRSAAILGRQLSASQPVGSGDWPSAPELPALRAYPVQVSDFAISIQPIPPVRNARAPLRRMMPGTAVVNIGNILNVAKVS